MKNVNGLRRILFFFVMFFFGIFCFWLKELDVLRTDVRLLPICYPGYVASKAAALISNYSRDHPIFLQMSDFFWVKNQSYYNLPYGTNGSEDVIMKFLAFANQNHFPPEIERLPCKRCVVVGNGFRLKNSSLGDVIDKYDIVIRLNNAPINKYQRDIGSKTTMRFFYPESSNFNPHFDTNPNSLLVLVPFKSQDLRWMKIIINDEKRGGKDFRFMPRVVWTLGSQNIRVLNPYFMEVAATRMLNHNQTEIKSKPTTGFLAITFALHFCDLVHVAGFGYPTSVNDTEPLHYYSSETLKSMDPAHDTLQEGEILKMFMQHQVIQNLTRV
uniref:CMP-N-acetylneuraminate-beta-galactosamide-alpha-2,3-sialyltransferase 4 n=1 Tax=Leptobrachium leishanense TaxID=445787 RepID=A0A8C5Q778_9ANUR